MIIIIIIIIYIYIYIYIYMLLKWLQTKKKNQCRRGNMSDIDCRIFFD